MILRQEDGFDVLSKLRPQWLKENRILLRVFGSWKRPELPGAAVLKQSTVHFRKRQRVVTRACRDLGLCAQERKTQARDGRGSENWGGLEMRCKSPEELAVHLKKCSPRLCTPKTTNWAPACSNQHRRPPLRSTEGNGQGKAGTSRCPGEKVS